MSQPLCRTLAALGFAHPTPIQAQAIPSLLQGRDVMGIAQTGTGKTAAFALPILQALADIPPSRRPRALILVPTRELAIQVASAFRDYGAGLKLRAASVIGGAPIRRQADVLRRGVDILIATPGRLLDLMSQRQADLGEVRHLVLDEADRMLDMGFIRDVRRIIAALPKQRQALLFSATMPDEVASLARDMLQDPVRVSVTPKVVTVAAIRQSVHFASSAVKARLLRDLLNDAALSRVIVFTRTKHRADRVADGLVKSGIPASAMHGNKSQGARQRALEDFRSGRVRALVATDIAARGIDVAGISHVINFDVPVEPESYVHRIGRTARAGAEGVAVTFCDETEFAAWRSIETIVKQPITVAGGERPHAVSRTPVKRPQNNRRHGRDDAANTRGGQPGRAGKGAHDSTPASQLRGKRNRRPAQSTRPARAIAG
ncbi:MAG: DEAD/DEAH box helicase [Alphaproteobacteria bacterium]